MENNCFPGWIETWEVLSVPYVHAEVFHSLTAVAV
jgi:hypothetical protein